MGLISDINAGAAAPPVSGQLKLHTLASSRFQMVEGRGFHWLGAKMIFW